MEKIVGKISFYGSDGNVGEVMEYTSQESYLNAIKKELDYNPDGFTHQTLTSDPEIRKSVDDLIYGAYGEDNPYTLDWYLSMVDNLEHTPDYLLWGRSCTYSTGLDFIWGLISRKMLLAIFISDAVSGMA